MESNINTKMLHRRKQHTVLFWNLMVESFCLLL